MHHLPRLFAVLTVVGILLGFRAPVQAQTVAVPLNGVRFTDVNGNTRTDRGNLKNDQINYNDCHSDGNIEFTVTLTNYGANSLQVWAGSGCDQLVNRGATGTTFCNQIGTAITPTSINPDPIVVPIKRLLYLRTLASGSSSNGTTDDTTSGGGGGGGGIDGTSGATTSSGGASVGTDVDDIDCTDKTGNSQPQAINLYIMLTDAAGNVAGSFVTQALKYKLVAPAPPNNVKPGLGEGIIPLTFDTDTSDTTINGYTFYCDPPPGYDAAADAGLLPVDGGDIAPCEGSAVLKAGHRADAKYKCGSTGARASSGNATGLLDGVPYNVAVATTDSYYNDGVLSQVVCRVPQPVTGFFEAYRNAGGEGGGGFCAFSRHREPLPLILLLGFAAYWVMRRRRAT